MKHCEDCGCKVYNGACTNCDEAIYIADQYREQDMRLPDEGSQFMDGLHEAERRQTKRLTTTKQERDMAKAKEVCGE